mmetsp:Transcript_3465/g.7106  ORF Transcript_3465/g.7106 Transcript_3465/m.7106 type:complete len:252 (-) Transcript_3465:30-785(-)
MVRIGIGIGSGRNGWFPPLALSLSLLPPEAVSLVVPAISYIYCSMDTDPWSSRAPTAGLDPLEVVVVDDATTQEYFAESLSSSLSLERMVPLEPPKPNGTRAISSKQRRCNAETKEPPSSVVCCCVCVWCCHCCHASIPTMPLQHASFPIALLVLLLLLLLLSTSSSVTALSLPVAKKHEYKVVASADDNDDDDDHDDARIRTPIFSAKGALEPPPPPATLSSPSSSSIEHTAAVEGNSMVPRSVVLRAPN